MSFSMNKAGQHAIAQNKILHHTKREPRKFTTTNNLLPVKHPEITVVFITYTARKVPHRPTTVHVSGDDRYQETGTPDQGSNVQGGHQTQDLGPVP